MIKIKAGDRVICYFGNQIYPSSLPIKGIVGVIKGDFIRLDDAMCPYWYHRKQCRKLVKVLKCNQCNGSGLIHPVGICDWCNGSGKVKNGN